MLNAALLFLCIHALQAGVLPPGDPPVDPQAPDAAAALKEVDAFLAGAKVGADVGAKLGATADADMGVKTDAGADIGATVDAGADMGIKTDAGADMGIKTDAGADTGATVDAGADMGIKTDAGADTGVKTDAGADIGVKTDAGTDMGATVDAGADMGAGVKTVDVGAGDSVIKSTDSGTKGDASVDASVPEDKMVDAGLPADGSASMKVAEKTVESSGSAMKAGSKTMGAGSSVDSTLKTADAGASTDTSMKSPDAGGAGSTDMGTGTGMSGGAIVDSSRPMIDPEVARQLAEVIRERAEAKLNPAVCDNCTAETCDIPDEHLCHKYVVCSRGQMNATTNRYDYVPLRMECAYGTYWDPSANSCNKPKTKDDCQHEPCKEPNMIAYKIDTDPNCKTYFQCDENRVSRPKCCPDNEGFNKTSQMCDPTVACRADHICPRLDKSVDMCNTDMFMRNSPVQDGNCRTFFKCLNMWSVGTCCPKGEMYAQDSEEECVPADTDACANQQCPEGWVVKGGPSTDPCRTDPTKSSFRYLDRCRHYMKCIETKEGTRISKPMCCPNGFLYDDVSEKCFYYNKDINKNAKPETCNDNISEDCVGGFFECGLRRGPSDKQYQHWGLDVAMNCPDGTRFNEYTCLCSTFVKNETYKCRKDFELLFDNPGKLKNIAQRNWVETKANSMSEDVHYRINAGEFDGKSTVVLAQLSFNDFEKFTIILRFSQDPNIDGSEPRQILFSNCRTDKKIDELSPSLEVALVRMGPNNNVIEILVSNNTHEGIGQAHVFETLQLPYEPGQPYEVAVSWDGHTIRATRKDLIVTETPDSREIQAQPISEVQEAVLTGRVYRGEHYAMIGACQLRKSVDLVNGFKGKLFLFEFAKCVLDSVKVPEQPGPV